MKNIKTEDLKPGMRFSEAVYIDNDTLLVEPNLPLKQKEIDRLIKWKVREVHTQGDVLPESEISEDTVLAQKGYHLSNSAGLELYEKSVLELEGVFTSVQEGRRAEHNAIDEISARLQKAVESDQDNTTQLILIPGTGKNLLSESSIKNAILSSIIGRTLKLYGFRLVQLTTGALLHDIGMLRIPVEIRAKKGALTAEELKIVKTHPAHGFNVVLKELKYPAEVANIVLHHQERWDGTGYPRGLKKDNIPLGARIVSVADAFEALVNKRAYRSPTIGYKAMKTILSDNGRHFDPQILRALLASLGIYPVGSLVLLNNSCIGKVVKNYPAAPVRPKIQLFINESGERMTEKKEIDLNDQKNLFIAKAIDPQEMDGMEDE